MTIRIKSKRLLLAMSILCSVPALAIDFDEEDLLELYGEDETVSISTGTNKPIRLAPSVATVITENDIAQLGATSLDQVLETVPGLHVSVAKNNKLNSVYSIRGVHTSRNAQVLVLIDDIPVRQLYGGGRPSNFLLPVENIKRIEIVRGPGSALHGADAFSGVINVVTKGAAEIDGTRAGLNIGSFDSRSYWLQHGRVFDNDWQLALSLERTESDGDDGRIVEADLQSAFDLVYGTAASLAPGPLATNFEVTNFRAGLRNESWDIAFSSWTQNGAGLGNGVAQALDHTGSVDVEYHVISTSYKASTSDSVTYAAKAWASYYDEEDRTFLLPAGSVVPIGSDGNLSVTGNLVSFVDGVIGNPGGNEKRFALEGSASLLGFANHQLRLAAGVEIQRGEVEETKNFGPGVLDGSQAVVDGNLTDVTGTDEVYADIENREIYFTSVQDSWKFHPDWEATLGLRYDWYSDVGGTLNPRAAIVWATSYNLTTKLLYGRAFRAPSFAELFAINNPVILGNANLDPETIDTLELAIDYQARDNLRTKVNFYWYEIDDAIDFVLSENQEIPGSSVAENAYTQEGTGFELELEWSPVRSLNIAANFSMQFAELDDTGERVADAPGRQFYISGNYTLRNEWNVNLSGNWVMDRRRSSIDAREQLKDFALIDLSVRAPEILPGMEIRVTGRNILDEDAREGSLAGQLLTAIPGDLPLPGRSLSLDIRYHLK